jgi:hypothetical protein
MTPIPQKVKKEMLMDPFYKICARNAVLKDHDCKGRITWEHTLTYAGRQIQKPWAIIGLCEWAHSVNNHQDGPGLNKEKNIWIALNRASEKELREVSKAIDYIRWRSILNERYGVYKAPELPYQPYELPYWVAKD